MQSKTIARITNNSGNCTDPRKVRRLFRAAKMLMILADFPYQNGSWCDTTSDAIKRINKGIQFFNNSYYAARKAKRIMMNK